MWKEGFNLMDREDSYTLGGKEKVTEEAKGG